MGSSIETHCKNCDDREEFITGIGFMYHRLEKVIQFTRGNSRKTLNEIIANHTITEADFEHRVFACPKCNTLHERFFIKVIYDDIKVFEAPYKCVKCHAGLVEMVNPVESYNCKKCGSQSLENVSIGLCWD